VGDARLDRRIGKSGINCLVELVDYLDRGATRRTDPLPTACLVTRHYFSNRRDVRQHIGARCRSHRQRDKFACSDVLDRCSQSIKHYWNLPGEKVGKRRPAASVRYMLHVHASHGLEQLAVDMLRASGTTGRHVNLAGIRLAYAMNSGSVLAGNDGWTTKTPNPVCVLATGAISRRISKLSLS